MVFLMLYFPELLMIFIITHSRSPLINPKKIYLIFLPTPVLPTLKTTNSKVLKPPTNMSLAVKIYLDILLFFYTIYLSRKKLKDYSFPYHFSLYF